MDHQKEENIQTDERLRKQIRVSHPTTRKSRSISRYFLGNKRSTNDITSQDIDIVNCLRSVGIFDQCELWTSVTLLHDYTTCRRLFIITSKNELIIGKSTSKQSLFKIKHRTDLNRVWLYTNITNIHDPTVNEVTSLTYYDLNRSIIIGWPLAENYLVEFDTKDSRNIWTERIQSNLKLWWNINSSYIEHVRVVIDCSQESEQNTNRTAFLIRKVISIRPQDTVRDLIKKCINASHLLDSSIDNYILYVLSDINSTSNTNHAIHSSLQFNQIQLIPLIGHEYPCAIKMKHLKTLTNTSFDGDDRSSIKSTTTLHSNHNSSTTSLNNISLNSHDFELRKRDNDNHNKKHRFFPKRKTKDSLTKLSPQQPFCDEYQSSDRSKTYSQTFGQTLEDIVKRNNNQLPPVIQKLLEILYYKGAETTGIFRKVANARSVRDAIDKIERNIPLHDEDLHPILAAGIFKHFLRSLPESIFNTIQYDNWKKCLRFPNNQEKICFARRNIISTLPESNHLLLKSFVCVLYRISQNAETNGMNPFNLGLCVSNSLFKTESTTITSGKQEADVMSSIVEFLIVNCQSLFGSDVLTCIPDKHVIVHPIPSLTRPTASSIESLDEVESSPHVPVVNRSRDSGLATSDPPFNDDSSEISEHFRRHTFKPDWTSSIACGTGTVLTSIIISTASSINRSRSTKLSHRPSKKFMARDKVTNDTTDDSDHDGFDVTNGDSSVRSSTTTVHSMAIGKIKRTKPISRHSSLDSNEHHHQHHQQNTTRDSKRSSTHDVKRTSSLKQFHRISDEGDDDDEQNETLSSMNTTRKKTSTVNKKMEPILPFTSLTNSKNILNERRSRLTKSKTKIIDDEIMITRSAPIEQQDLDLTSEPLSTINQRLTNPSTARSASFTWIQAAKKSDSPMTNDLPNRHSSIITDGRSRHAGPLAATTNQIYITSRTDHRSQTNLNTKTQTERDRTFVHHSDSRPFKLGSAIQMKPIDDIVTSNVRCRPCHRQNALRYKSVEKDEDNTTSLQSVPIIMNQNRIYTSENSSANISRHQSIERRYTGISQPIKSYSFDANDDLRPSEISWSVREKAKLFEHANQNKLSTGRENYV